MRIYEYNNLIIPLKNTNLSEVYVEDKFNWWDNFIQKIIRDFINVDFNLLKLNTIFLNWNKIKEILKNTYYYIWKENIDEKLKFCKSKNKRLSTAETLKIMFLKKNWYFIINWKDRCMYTRLYKEEFQYIKKHQKEILEKIDEQLKEIEEKENKQKINPKVLEFLKNNSV